MLFEIRYFEDDDEPPTSSLEYIPAPGSPTYDLMKKTATKNESDSEEDPLDAFMAGIDAEVKRNNSVVQSDVDHKEDKSKGFRADIDGEDDEESYYRFISLLNNIICIEEDHVLYIKIIVKESMET